jgi:hypothetical protein
MMVDKPMRMSALDLLQLQFKTEETKEFHQEEVQLKEWPISKRKDGKWSFVKMTKPCIYSQALRMARVMQAYHKSCEYRIWDCR